MYAIKLWLISHLVYCHAVCNLLLPKSRCQHHHRHCSRRSLCLTTLHGCCCLSNGWTPVHFQTCNSWIFWLLWSSPCGGVGMMVPDCGNALTTTVTISCRYIYHCKRMCLLLLLTGGFFGGVLLLIACCDRGLLYGALLHRCGCLLSSSLRYHLCDILSGFLLGCP